VKSHHFGAVVLGDKLNPITQSGLIFLIQFVVSLGFGWVLHAP
jgi:hypothetical protein